MAAKTWNLRPLSTVIVELLQRKGSATDAELHEMIKGVQGDLGFNVLNRELMRLEIRGAIRVSPLTRGKRRVELVQDKGKAT